ncbi:MAG: hypothetical protein OEW08_14405, partial [Gammaproteobacteria bacterium]|nr:hypothetical protein [Gammaproteobacteria bacterium]
VLPNKEYAQWAARVERAGGEMDWSLSYFDGYDKGPDLHPGQMTLSGMTIDLVHPRIRTLGADAAGTLGRWGWRVEGAYTRSTDSAGKDIFAKNPFFYAVAGVDRTMFDGLNANLQYVYRYIFHYEDPLSAVLPLQGLAKAQALANNQFDQQQHGATLRVHQAWWNDTLTAELSMMMWWQHKDYVFKPKMSYAWSDHLKTTLGADMYRGPQDSFLGNLRKLSLAYVELQWAY